MGSTCGRLIRTLNGSSPTTAKEYVAFPPFHTKNENYFIERGIFTVLNQMYLVIDRLVQAWVEVIAVLAAHKKKTESYSCNKKEPCHVVLGKVIMENKFERITGFEPAT